MTSTVFTDYTTPIVASWLNDVNSNIYKSDGTKYLPPTFSEDFAVSPTGRVSLRGQSNVKAHGAAGNGVADDSAAFALAVADVVANGGAVRVPSGTYKLDSSVTATGARVYLDAGATITGTGRLVGALVERIDASSGAVSFGVGEALQYGSYYKFGRNAGGPIGLTVGGGDSLDGDNGNVLYPDTYSAWTTLQPMQYPSSVELAIQGSTIAGAGGITSGGNTLTRNSGAAFVSEMVGRRIYIGASTYKVATVNAGAGTLTVTNVDGSAVTFASTATVTYVFAGIKGSGTCNVSGTTVTRVSGDPFVPATNTEYLLTINGTSRTVSSITNTETLVISADIGTLTNATYTFWTSVDDLISAVRVHRVTGAGFEENLSLGAYGNGYFAIHAAGGVAARQYPLKLGSGYNTDGTKRAQLVLQSDGYVTIGGDAGQCSLQVTERDKVASNFVWIEGSNTGVATGIRASGADTNVSLSISTKGTGAIRFLSANYGVVEFEVTANAAGIAWVGAKSDAFNQPQLYAAGAASNIDINLKPKGTGRVLIGPWTTNADAAVNGYIEVKDSTGSVRKVATIA